MAATARSRQLLARMIRVNHAGEFGAQRIYAGQLAVLRDTPSGPVIKVPFASENVTHAYQEMADQEDEHFDKFSEFLKQRRVRPTVLEPFWKAAGFALGAATAALGSKAAMACTVAVEEVIGDHYNQQLRDMLEEGLDKTEPELFKVYE